MRHWSGCVFLPLVYIIVQISDIAKAQVLSPPYFNLATKRPISATATCGETINSEPELYCKLTGSTLSRRDGNFPTLERIIQGQSCDYCDQNVNSHPASQATDGTEKWWQSPPLSRGVNYNGVNLTIDLGQEFHVAYVFIKMANSPRPGVWVLERSLDFGRTFKPWQYFADTDSDCYNFFGIRSQTETQISQDDQVICTTEYSKVVPLENGEIVVSLVNNRPSAGNFSYSSRLQDWTKATFVRLRLIRTKTLLGHLMAKARQDPSVTRRYYYSIKDISIGGRCVCNGHAELCDLLDPTQADKLLCRCQHNTCGAQCETCCPGFVQKKWRKATLQSVNKCEACQCYGHSTDCTYDAEIDRLHLSIDIHGQYGGGGVCNQCLDNTEGINCERCKGGFYRPTGVLRNDTNACRSCNCDLSFSTGDCEDGTGRCKCRPEYTGQNCERCSLGYYGYPSCIPCDCHVNGTAGSVCQVGGGQCPCKTNYDGKNCDRCALGFYQFPKCDRCGCDRIGSSSTVCDSFTGQCPCNSNYLGQACDRCQNGYYGYPRCQFCDCDTTGTNPEICSRESGRCLCKPNFTGAKCDQCAPGFYNYPSCIDCQCGPDGSLNGNCDLSGQCPCNPNFSGRTCQQCGPGYYRYPQCLACKCDSYGSVGLTCDQSSGQCTCYGNFQGVQCDKCAEKFYNYPVCEACTCNPAGAKEVPGLPLGGCGSHQDGRLCECKDRVQGHICNTCKPGYWNLNINNPNACDECACHAPGTIAGETVCHSNTGQCRCKPRTTGRQCNMCVDGTYKLQAGSLFGCKDCGCDVGGSLDNNCDKTTGQCKCRPRVIGRKCDKPLRNHYFPTLYQYRYEIEDGHTPQGTAVRFGFDEGIFPQFSWRGYAIMSHIQPEVIIDLTIEKPELYMILYRYINRNNYPVRAEVKVTPELESLADIVQTSSVTFKPTRTPQYVLVDNNKISTFVLNPGKWTISIKTPDRLLLDFLVVLPQPYYEANVLQEYVNMPCLYPVTNKPCLHYMYVDITTYPVGRGEVAYVIINSNKTKTQLVDKPGLTKELGTKGLAKLDKDQKSIYMDIPIPFPGRYVLVMLYHTIGGHKGTQELSIDVQDIDGVSNARAILYECEYTTLCRQVVTNSTGRLAFFDIEGKSIRLTISGKDDVMVAIDSVYAIPWDKWSPEIINPKVKCLRENGVCTNTHYGAPPTASIKIEIENPRQPPTQVLPPGVTISAKVVELGPEQPTATIRAQVTLPGPYVWVVHYYQPLHPEITIDVKLRLNGSSHDGKVKLPYCANPSGCRAVIDWDTEIVTNVINLPTIDYQIYFNNTKGPKAWIDYIVVTPSDKFDPITLKIVPVIDKAGEFITTCAGSNFNVDPNSPSINPFCRMGLYSITILYNNGGIDCSCDSAGSVTFQCQEAGGQCACKPNIIGRGCTQCRTGYWGFPDCKPCDCPSKLCEVKTGACVCPPKVTGANCDSCVAKTFGFDPFIGCEDCNCVGGGVRGGNLVCDISSGQCACKENIGGRQCAQCLPGFHTFPTCDRCNCDVRGATEQICDSVTKQCLCKEFVVNGNSRCNTCQPGHFYLESRNPSGCTKCFCFGQTNNCASSTFRMKTVMKMDSWNLTNTEADIVPRRNGTAVNDPQRLDPLKPMYWIAPKEYLGNKVTSYGGKLSYTVEMTISNITSKPLHYPHVKLMGNNMTIVADGPRNPTPGKSATVVIDILEIYFRHEIGGDSVSRQQFMQILADLMALHIQASYYDIIDNAILENVQLDMAHADGTGEVALNAEQCDCPPNYHGTSCEECADGYYRSERGPCVPCQCNRHASTCDKNTGQCIGCLDNTYGDNCEKCLRGYHGDPLIGSCSICSCPLNVPSNNFAASCVLDGVDVVLCQCDDGYAGNVCDRCAVGWYGVPTQLGQRCQQCDCNNNIDRTDRGSCDSQTGSCLKCLYNTAGDNCERCNNGWWGDAVTAKNCQQCTCDSCGTKVCNHKSGQCECKSNIEGTNCEKCSRGYYGYRRCVGCEDCECGAASLSRECDDNTGQCQCQAGVEGRRCDKCIRGFWDYGSNGCKKCDCDITGTTTCDPVDGICKCLPGVTGNRCDRCLPRWVLVSGEGCRDCDSCIHLLLDDTEAIEHTVSLTISNIHNVSVGVLAFERLNNVSKQVSLLRPKVDALLTANQSSSSIKPLLLELEDAEKTAKSVLKQSKDLVDKTKIIASEASDIKDEVDKIVERLKKMNASSQDVVRFIDSVTATIQSGKFGNIEELVTAAKVVLAEIGGRNFSGTENDAEDEIRLATLLLETIKFNKNSMDDVTTSINKLGRDLNTTKERLLDLQRRSKQARMESEDSGKITEKNRLGSKAVLDKIDEININREIPENLLKQGYKLLKDANQALVDAEGFFRAIELESSKLSAAMKKMETKVDYLKEENPKLKLLVEEARKHADGLVNQAKILDNVIADTRELSKLAVKAAKSYESILGSIAAASNASNKALGAAMESLTLSEGQGGRASASLNKSRELLTSAQAVKKRSESELVDSLAGAKKSTSEIEDLNKKVLTNLEKLNAGLGMLSADGFGTAAKAASSKAMDAGIKSMSASDKVSSIINKLPNDEKRVDTIRKDIASANTDLNKATTQVDMLQTLVPDASLRVNKLTTLAQNNNLTSVRLGLDLERLKDSIVRAKQKVDKIKVGINFNRSSTLQLRTPENLKDGVSFTEIKLWVNATQGDGLLLYLGPDKADPEYQSGVVEYMALYMDNGHVNYVYDLGSGPIKIRSSKQLVLNKWYQVVAKRTGKSGSLIINEDNVPFDTVNNVGNGTSIVFGNGIKDKYFRLFVGGVPDQAVIPDTVEFKNFQGEMEDLTYNNHPIGLWNSVSSSNIAGRGALVRDTKQAPQGNGKKFNGEGYIKFGRGTFNPGHSARAHQISMDFETYDANGLIFLMSGSLSSSNAPDIIAIQIKDGKVSLAFNLGTGYGILTTQKQYNDGKSHKLIVDLQRNKGQLQVETEKVGPGDSKGTAKNYNVERNIYIGGRPNQNAKFPKEVVKQGFNGCIKNVNLNGKVRDLNVNDEEKNARPGCPHDVIQEAYFNNSHVEYKPLDGSINVNSKFELSFKFKTEQPEGLLFYTSNNKQSNALSISMVNGYVILISKARNDIVKLQSHEKLNDGRWNIINIKKDNLVHQLFVNDNKEAEGSADSRSKVNTNSTVFLGGVPGKVKKANVATSKPFDGCIGDIIAKDKLIDFGGIPPNKKVGVSLVGCPINVPEVATTIEPTPDPQIPSPIKDPTRCVLLTNITTGGADEGKGSGTRFGSLPNGRQEIKKIPESVQKKSAFSIEFKTTSKEGVIFYTAGGRHLDYISLSMKDGSIVYKFSSGSTTTYIKSKNTFNEGKWHKAEFIRSKKLGTLKIDGQAEGEGTDTGSTSSLDVSEPYYVGGLSKETAKIAISKRNVESGLTFMGCLRNLQLNGIAFEAPSYEVGTSLCSNTREVGVYIPSQGQYITLQDKFKVGLDLEISIEVRPRTMSGIILSVGSPKGDYLILQMVEGKLIFSANNGGGELNTTWTPTHPYVNTLCNGYWHTIKAAKFKNLVQLFVDGKQVIHTGIGTGGVSSTDTNDPLFIGGVPDPTVAKGAKTDKQFIGCIRKLQLNKRLQDISTAKATPGVQKDSCPVK